MMEFKGKRVLVIGLGASGYASARFLAEKDAIVKVTENASSPATERYERMLQNYAVEIETGRHTEGFCSDSEIAITSPGVDIRSQDLLDALPEGIPIIGELELAFIFSKAPVIAVTGTNGKSTTAELIGKILSCSGRRVVVCGNIGTPFISKVDELGRDSIAVVEVSSFQLETIKDFKPKVAVLLNITEDHYDRHHTYDDYKREKFKIFRNQDRNDWAVMHSDFMNDERLKGLRSQIQFFGHAGALAGLEGDRIIYKENRETYDLMSVDEVPLKGRHNLDNVLSSIMVSRILGESYAHIRKGIKEFVGLKHRFESVGVLEGVEYIDDSKATNIDATRRALESLTKKVVLIAGGRDKGGDYGSILPLVKEKVKTMVAIGESSQKIKTVFARAVPVITAGTMKEAVELASSSADKGEAVLLSPMCSSFDMFTDYKQRGRTFRKEVGL